MVSGAALVRTTEVGKNSVLSRIVALVRQAQASRPPLQKLADRIAAIFVPAVLGISLLTLVVNFAFLHHPFGESMSRAIAVLVISCPCAMGIATPAAIAVGLGRAARMGILVKGGNTLERIKTIKTIVFDKTGTLTTGSLRITAFEVVEIEEKAAQNIIVSLEKHSAHPIARSILAQWKNAADIPFTDVREQKGFGMEAHLEGRVWKQKRSWAAAGQGPEGFDLYLSEAGHFRGALKLEDELRPDAADTLRVLRTQGYHTVLLSGDRQEKVESVARQVGIEEMYAGQTPEDKAAVLERLMQSGGVAMVGDGINDAPSLARATVAGISLSKASQIAVQSAQIILSGNRFSVLPQALKLGIYTERTIRSNLFWAFLYNVVAIPVAAAGYLSPTWGAGVMALSDVVLVLNSLFLGVRRLR